MMGNFDFGRPSTGNHSMIGASNHSGPTLRLYFRHCDLPYPRVFPRMFIRILLPPELRVERVHLGRAL